MNFIEKTHHPETRKPAFRWLGTRGKSDNGSANTSVLNESKKRISKKNICKYLVDLISLEEAAEILLGDAHAPSMMRNNSAAKVRRLYDIANVLSSMNFVEKTHHPETRKPAFKWLGTRGKSDNGSANTSVLNESKKRISKKSICKYLVDLISLEEAAKILLGDAHDPSMMRTKVRRLYDIEKCELFQIEA